jgi:superoxide reductase
MSKFSDYIQEADWKTEKHAPVIECAAEVKAGEAFKITTVVGKEIAHPNTTEHHIRWIDLYFHAEGEKFAYQIGHYEFSAHGESVPGPNQGPVYSIPEVTVSVKFAKSGTIHAMSFCNIHGLWQSSKEIRIA